MRLPLRLAPLALLAAVSACTSPRPAASPDADGPRACTMEFRTIAVTVVHASGQPADGARVEVRRTSGETIATDPALAMPSEGRYVIADDGTRVVPTGETVTVNASKDGRAVAGVYRLGHDGCHIQKLSGADTLRLR